MTAPISDERLAELIREVGVFTYPGGGTDEYRERIRSTDPQDYLNACLPALRELQQARARIGEQDVRIIELVMQRDAMKAELAGVREALESIRIFARDCIDTGHDRGALGNLYAIVDLCDRSALAASEGR